MSVVIALKLQTTFILLSHKSTSFTEIGGGGAGGYVAHSTLPVVLVLSLDEYTEE